MIKTERLILRPWQDIDFEEFAALNADSRVMEYFPSTLTREESDKLAKIIQTKIVENGWGFFAVSVPGVSDFIGFIGLNQLTKEHLPVHFTPAVEVGWRLSYKYWGNGYAPEGARACLQYAFEKLGLSEVVAYTAQSNQRSRIVMEKIGMHYDSDADFNHPKLAVDNHLCRHVLYRIKSK